ncbi:hypothetical protein P8452_42689 [Trifolium repens]|nr:hypothetical protein P8452_42689 [Trifolium repens]
MALRSGRNLNYSAIFRHSRGSEVLCEKRRIEKELWRKLLVEFARGHLPPYVLILMIWKCLKLKVQVYNMVVDISWPSIMPMQ